MNTVKKIKLIINKTNKETFDFWLRKCRILYNVCLDERKFYYQATGKNLNMYDQKKELVDIKDLDKTWGDVPSKALQEIVFRVNKSFQRFFEGAGYPKYKNDDTFKSIVLTRGDVKVKNGLAYLPKIKNGIRGVEEFPTEFSSVKLVKDNGYYFLNFTCSTNPITNLNLNDGIVGIDLGLSSLMTDSNGYVVKRFPLKLIKKYGKRIAELNQSLSTKKKGSRARNKVKKQLNKAHTRLKNSRTDYLQKQSTKYIKQLKEDIVIVGDLKVKKLMKSNKSKKQRNFSRAYSNASISLFKTMLEYKIKWSGKIFDEEDEAYTSKTCSCCGTVKHDLKVKDRVYNCNNCDLSIPRDENGAINIKKMYLGIFNPIGVKLNKEKVPNLLGHNCSVRAAT